MANLHRRRLRVPRKEQQTLETEALVVALVMGLRWTATMGLRVIIAEGHIQSHASAICSQDHHVFHLLETSWKRVEDVPCYS